MSRIMKKIKIDFPDSIEWMKIVPGSKHYFRVLDEPVEQEKEYQGKKFSIFLWLVYDFTGDNIKCVSITKNGTKQLLEIMSDPEWWGIAKKLGGWDIILERTVSDLTHRFSNTIIRPTVSHKHIVLETKIKKNWELLIGKSSVSNPIEIDEVDSIMNRMGYPLHP